MSGSQSQQQNKDDGQVELESQIILRLPPTVAKILRDSLRPGSPNLKERLSLKMDNDMRHGMLYFDHFVLHAKLVDLPCIIESFKTIDKKTVYKTADVCQMLICSEEPEPEDNDPKPLKKKDGIVKVEKKYLWPHGVTPPLKNVRKRRFRRTLKKKQYSDQPEIEKEVRRLFRTDYEATHVSWEVIDEEEDKSNKDGTSTKDVLMQGSKTNENPSTSRMTVELFGDTLSDSDVDEGDGGGDMDFESRLSMDDDGDESRISRMSDSMSMIHESDTRDQKAGGSGLVTSFSKDMFEPSSNSSAEPSPRKGGSQSDYAVDSELLAKKNSIEEQLRVLRDECNDLEKRREIQENELATVENMALRSRLDNNLRRIMEEQNDKEGRMQELQMELSLLE